MMEILQRYLVYNSHANSYTWKYNGKNLDINQTLQVGISTKNWKELISKILLAIERLIGVKSGKKIIMIM